MKIPVLALALTVLAPPAFALKPGDAVPDHVLQRLGAFPDHIIVVDFFAEWCESCRKELPLISAFSERADPARVSVIGVDTDEDVAVGKAFQAEMKAQGALSFRVIDDPGQTLVNEFKPRGYPALYLIQHGKIVGEHLGATPDIDVKLRQDLQRLGAPAVAHHSKEE